MNGWNVAAFILIGFISGVLVTNVVSDGRNLRIQCESQIPRNEKCVMKFIVEGKE